MAAIIRRRCAFVRKPQAASNSEALSALGAARGDHGAATARSHAHQKPVRASAFDL